MIIGENTNDNISFQSLEIIKCCWFIPTLRLRLKCRNLAVVICRDLIL